MNRKRNAQGFTLIELLVVVAIMAVLVSILLPALQQARTQARTVACQSNLRQLAVLIHMYADANADFLPPAFNAGCNYSWRGSWAGEVGYFLHPEAYYKQDMGRDLSLFFCPESEKEVLASSGSAQSSYMYSWMIHNANSYWSGAGPIGRRNALANCPDEKRTILHCAQTNKLSGYYGLAGAPYCTFSWGQQWYEYLSRYHNNGANFLFVAGNVKWIEDLGGDAMYIDNATGNTEVRWW